MTGLWSFSSLRMGTVLPPVVNCIELSWSHMTREQMLVLLVPFTCFNGLGLVIAETNNLRVLQKPVG